MPSARLPQCALVLKSLADFMLKSLPGPSSSGTRARVSSALMTDIPISSDLPVWAVYNATATSADKQALGELRGIADMARFGDSSSPELERAVLHLDAGVVTLVELALGLHATHFVTCQSPGFVCGRCARHNSNFGDLVVHQRLLHLAGAAATASGTPASGSSLQVGGSDWAGGSGQPEVPVVTWSDIMEHSGLVPRSAHPGVSWRRQ